MSLVQAVCAAPGKEVMREPDFSERGPVGLTVCLHETAFPNTEELNLSFYFTLICLNANMHL